MNPPARGVLSRRSFLRAAAVAGTALAGAAGGCAGPTGTPGPGTMTLAFNRSLISLDNKLNQFDAAVTIQRAVRQALTRIGDQRPELVLADRFELTGLTQWTVRLRDGVRYSDGTPVTVEDVAVALRCYEQTNASFVGAQFPEWPRVVPVDDRTFRLETERPVPILDSLMADILITPAAANQPGELQEGVGSGPYVITAADSGTGNYTLSANARYWGPPPTVQTVAVRFVPEESSRVVALRSGEVDVIDSISPDSAEQLVGLPGISLDTVTGTRASQLFYNFRKPAGHPMADARVRQALSWAVDGDALVRDVLVGSVTAATGVVPLTLTGAVETGRYAYDPERARATLAELGVRDLALTFIWETGEFTNDVFVMETLVEMLGRVGVRVQLRQFEPGGGIDEWRRGRAGDWDVLGNGYGNQNGLALTSIQGMFAGTAEAEQTRDTYHGYVFPEVTALIEAASAEPDATARADLLARAQHAIWETWPCLWAFTPNAVLARRDRVDGVALTPINSYELASARLEA